MTDDRQQEAAETAKRAKGEAKAAARDAGRAAKAASEPVVEAVRDEAHETAEKARGTAQDAAEAVHSAASRVNPTIIAHLSSDLGVGFFATAVSIYSGLIAAHKFKGVYAARKLVVR